MSAIECMRETNDNDFQKKVKYYMQKAAISVLGEEGSTAGHADRLVYAKKILAGEASIKEYCIGIVTNTTIAGKIAAAKNYDDDLEFVVNSMFSDFAGYDG